MWGSPVNSPSSDIMQAKLCQALQIKKKAALSRTAFFYFITG